MEVLLTFSIAGAVILLGFLGEWIFEKTSIPDPLWLMVFGILLNKAYFLSSNDIIREVGALFAVFAMIFILFEGVMNSDLKSLFIGFMRGSGLAIIHFFLTILVTVAAMLVFGWGWLESLLLGIILGDAAQTVIIPLAKKINVGKESYAALTFESALSDVLCIIGAITVVSVMNLNTITFTEVSKTVLYSFSVGILLGIAGGFIWVGIHKKMDSFSKSYITTIAALIMLYSFVEYLGANGALACLAFGVIIANSSEIFAFFKKTTEESSSSSEKFFYAEISFFVKSFFFVYLGIMINLAEIQLIVLGFLLALLIFIVRPLSVKISGLTKKISEKDRIYVEILNPKGTSAAVLAQLPLQYGIVHAAEISTIISSVIGFSILLCVITVFLASKGYFHGIGQLLDIRPLFTRK